MNRLITLIVCLALTHAHVTAQDGHTSRYDATGGGYSSNDSLAYLQRANFEDKSRDFKTAGLILAPAGVVLGIVGYFVAKSGEARTDFILVNNEELLGSGLILLGSAMVITSIPLLMKASSYKRKALRLSAAFKYEQNVEPRSTGLTNNSFPVASIKFRF